MLVLVKKAIIYNKIIAYPKQYTLIFISFGLLYKNHNKHNYKLIMQCICYSKYD